MWNVYAMSKDIQVDAVEITGQKHSIICTKWNPDNINLWTYETTKCVANFSSKKGKLIRKMWICFDPETMEHKNLNLVKFRSNREK